MSAQPSQYGPGAGKKAVHVKWAGKTIALGTFPSAEADEKCARAKALTRAWRSTMRPKPSREWVMLELERLQVRVVSGRLGRKGADGEDEEEEHMMGKKQGMPPITDPALLRRDSLLSGMGGSRRDSITGLLSAADMAGSVNRNNSLGFGLGDSLGDLMAQRRSSSLGLSLLPDSDSTRRNSSLNLSSVLDGGDGMPPHRPLVGGGSAAAYEAARADHYSSMAQKARSEQERRASGMGSLGGGQMGLSVNPNQHYEMLKLHHMNLLNEIQETTLMMNLYQQQQLQQQQQQISHHDSGGGNSDQMALLLQQGMGGHGRMGSLGGASASAASGDMQVFLRQQQQMMSNGGGSNSQGGNNGQGGNKVSEQNGNSAAEDEASLQQRLQALKDDIARHQKEAEELAKAQSSGGSAGGKRKATPSEENNVDGKKIKAETVDHDDDDDDDDDDDE